MIALVVGRVQFLRRPLELRPHERQAPVAPRQRGVQRLPQLEVVSERLGERQQGVGVASLERALAEPFFEVEARLTDPRGVTFLEPGSPVKI